MFAHYDAVKNLNIFSSSSCEGSLAKWLGHGLEFLTLQFKTDSSTTLASNQLVRLPPAGIFKPISYVH